MTHHRRVRIALPALAAPTLLVAAATAQDWSSTTQIGTTRAGRPIQVQTLGAPGADAHGRTRDQRPALLIVAGVQGHHAVGRDAAHGVAERVLDEHRDLLETHTLYVIHQLNPDGAGWLSASPALEFGRAPVPGDADGDRRTDEDGADDLNNDGLITMMRIANPSPSSGLKAEWVIDDVEPRLLREPKPEDGEIATHALLVEGLDNDGDGKLNEDGPGGGAGGGVDLDMNFPSHYDEHADGAGLYTTSEPETRAIIDWLLTRDNIVAALVYGPHDNLVNTPATGKFDQTGRMPRGIEKGDEPMHKAIGEVFTNITGMKEAPTGETTGSLVSYLYSDFGVWAFSTPVWVRPDLVKQDADESADEAPAEETAEPEAPDEATILRDQGVPEFIVEFLTASEEDRADIMAGFESLSPEEQASRMEQVSQLPEDVRNRVMAIAQGGEDPGMPTPEEAEQESADKKPDGKSKADKDELAWLKYSDEQREGVGFVEWTEVEHPQLGTVEVGGFAPGFRLNPPETELDSLVEQQTEFVAALLAKLPSLRVSEPEAQRLGDGLWRVSVRATNPGYLPTRSAMGVKARRTAPVVISIDVEPDAIVSGARHRQFWAIEGSGGVADCEWIIRADAGQAIDITTRSSVYGDRARQVVLKEGR